MPCRISACVTVVVPSEVAGCEAIQAETARSGVGRISSDSTFVSSRITA